VICTSIADLVATAIILGVTSQFLIFREFHPLAASLVGPVLIAVPYSLSRAGESNGPWAAQAECKILVNCGNCLYWFMALWYTRCSSPLACGSITAI
jgi:hypothetical protein